MALAHASRLRHLGLRQLHEAVFGHELQRGIEDALANVRRALTGHLRLRFGITTKHFGKTTKNCQVPLQTVRSLRRSRSADRTRVGRSTSRRGFGVSSGSARRTSPDALTGSRLIDSFPDSGYPE